MIDVIVPQFNQVAHTLRFLDSFKRYAPKDVRLIFVDNGSDKADFDAAAKALTGVNHALIRNEKNLGFVAAVNQGLAVSTADYVVLQNNDTEIFSGCYERMKQALVDNPDAGVVGVVSSPESGWQSIDKLMKYWKDFAEVLLQAEPHVLKQSHCLKAAVLRVAFARRTRQAPHMVAFFCAMFPKSTFEKFGNLSTDYGEGLGDDDDYCARLRQAGVQILVALDVYVFHNHRTTWKARFTQDEIKQIQTKNIAKLRENWAGKVKV